MAVMWETYLRFRGAIIPVLDRDMYPIEWLDTLVYAGFAKVWAEAESCILAEVKTYPGGASEIHGLVAVGDVDTITSVLIPRAEAFGRSIGCKFGAVSSRPGWVRKLKDYEVYQVHLRKEL